MHVQNNVRYSLALVYTYSDQYSSHEPYIYTWESDLEGKEPHNPQLKHSSSNSKIWIFSSKAYNLESILLLIFAGSKEGEWIWITCLTQFLAQSKYSRCLSCTRIQVFLSSLCAQHCAKGGQKDTEHSARALKELRVVQVQKQVCQQDKTIRKEP